MEANAKTTTIRGRRHRPLLRTCAVSMTNISGKARKMIKDYDEPIGLMLNKTLALASTTRIFIYMMHRIQWLTVLAFIDDSILVVEQKIETLFPPSSHVFDKMDSLVESIEWLPQKFEDGKDKLQSALRKYPFLQWALVHAVSWLNLMVSILFTFDRSSSRERDIMIDINCDAGCENEESRTIESCDESPTPQCDQKESSPTAAASEFGVTKCTYKEILEKGKNEGMESRDNCNEMNNMEERKDENGVGNEDTKIVSGDDPILELFESGWHMKPAKGAMPSPMGSSASLDSCR